MIPEVRNCKAKDCFYNRSERCRANSVLINGIEGNCDTFWKSDGKHSEEQGSGTIGACHVGDCQYNMGYYCKACGDIEIDNCECGARCMTSFF